MTQPEPTALELLADAAAQFRVYEHSHRTKAARFDPELQPDMVGEQLTKAEVNAAHAQRIEDYLAQRASGRPDKEDHKSG